MLRSRSKQYGSRKLRGGSMLMLDDCHRRMAGESDSLTMTRAQLSTLASHSQLPHPTARGSSSALGAPSIG
eukprot:scaffold157692_cov30-Tisochrysis_lutea.AAC.3